VLFELVLFLHLALMFTAVAVAYGGVIFFLVALRAGNVAGLIAMTTSAKTTERVIPILFISGGIFGLLTAIVTNSNLLAPWLLIAYALFVVLTIIGARFTAPAIARIGEAVAAAPDGPLPAEVVTLRSRFYRLEVFDFFFLFLIIFDMVVKPFS